MGDKRKKKDKPGRAVASGKVKLPKRIGGVKLSKDVRRSGEALLELANSPAGRGMILAGIGALADRARSSARLGPTTPNLAPHQRSAAPAEPAIGNAAGADPDDALHALGAAAGLVLQRLLTGRADR